MGLELDIYNLGHQLTETRLAAAKIIIGMCNRAASTPEEVESLALGFEQASIQAANEAEAHLNRLVAAALRRDFRGTGQPGRCGSFRTKILECNTIVATKPHA